MNKKHDFILKGNKSQENGQKAQFHIKLLPKVTKMTRKHHFILKDCDTQKP